MRTVSNSNMTITYEVHGNLYVNMTNRCPCACEFCVRGESDSVGGSDSLWLEREPTVDEIIESIKSRDLSSYGEIVFCGFGEPTCRLEDLLLVARALREFCTLPLRLNTNGLSDLINGRDTAREFAGLFDTISISLNASNPEAYNALCHPKYGLEAFPALLTFTKALVPLIPHVVLSVVDSISAEELARCRKISEDCGAALRVRKLIGTE